MWFALTTAGDSTAKWHLNTACRMSAKQPAKSCRTPARGFCSRYACSRAYLHEQRRSSGPDGQFGGREEALGPRAGCSTIAYLEEDHDSPESGHSLLPLLLTAGTDTLQVAALGSSNVDVIHYLQTIRDEHAATRSLGMPIYTIHLQRANIAGTGTPRPERGAT